MRGRGQAAPTAWLAVVDNGAISWSAQRAVSPIRWTWPRVYRNRRFGLDQQPAREQNRLTSATWPPSLPACEETRPIPATHTRTLPDNERQDQESQRETVIGRPCVGGSVSGRSRFSSFQLAMNRRHGVNNQAVKARRLVVEYLTPGKATTRNSARARSNAPFRNKCSTRFPCACSKANSSRATGSKSARRMGNWFSRRSKTLVRNES